MKHYFTKLEIALWSVSTVAIVLSFLIFDRSNYMTLAASLIGVTSLIFNAKGNPLGPLLIIFFSTLYGIISYAYRYYGEVITYLFMTAPMAVLALISWLRNPYKGNKAEVEINQISRREVIWALLLSVVVTVLFYFILVYFGTANILPSTLSVTTSFIAVYLTYRRSPYFALAYAANDVILIILWILAAMEDITYVSVIVCFAVFLVNDLYGFINWRKIERRQRCDI